MKTPRPKYYTEAAHLPPTTGRWVPIRRWRTAPVVVAWIEVFPVRGAWVTVPGTSRYVGA